MKDKDAQKLAEEINRFFTTNAGFGVLALLAVVLLVELWANWRLIRRMGYPGPWSLFLWVPYVSVLFWAGIAFWRWPNQKN